MIAEPRVDVLELIQRVRRVGWEVSENDGGYRFKTPKGAVALDLKHADNNNSIRVVTRRLEGDGLREVEQAMAEIAAAQGRAPRKTTRKAAPAATFTAPNDDDVEQAPAQIPDALIRAAGPYLTEPETVGIAWFAQPHPAPWMRWVWMTPEIAAYLIAEHNNDNRPLRPNRVEHYRKIIDRNEWYLTHQGMAMDTRAIQQDGQHRLAAIAAFAETRPTLRLAVPFFVGMDPDNFRAIDEGLNRSPQDLFAKGGETYGVVIAAAVRLVMAYQDQSPRMRIREKGTNELITRFFETDAEELRAAAKFAALNWRKAYTTTGPLAAAYYLLRRTNGTSNRYVEAFLEGLLTGRKAGSRLTLDDHDPRQVCRSYFHNLRLQRKRLPAIEALAVIISAWNNVVEGRQPRSVRFTRDYDIPKIIILKDDGTDMAIHTAPLALEGEVTEPDGNA